MTRSATIRARMVQAARKQVMDDVLTMPEMELNAIEPGLTLPDYGTAPTQFPPLRLMASPGGASLVIRRVDTIIGRHSRADVVLPSMDVSRTHCRISLIDNDWWAIDLGSTNGTFVNDESITRCRLRMHDRIRVGGFEFQVEREKAAANLLKAAS